ncbi:hypothetical protein [Sinomicrobium oceani]|nr:hypothetical protein [Sinomicrobium oceani]
MRPEKKPLQLSDNEKAILDILKLQKSMPLDTLKNKTELSNKAWDKGMKGLSKLGLIKVEVSGDSKTVVLQDQE